MSFKGFDNHYSLFTFVWKLQNWQIYLGDTLTSPTFTIRKFFNTQWHLQFSSGVGGSTTECEYHLIREENSDGPDEIEISFATIIYANSKDHSSKDVIQGCKKFSKGTFKQCCISWDKLTHFLRNFQYIYVVCHMEISPDDTKKAILDDALIPNYLKLNFASSSFSTYLLEAMQKDLQCLKKHFIHFPNTCLANTVILLEKKKVIWTLKNILNKKKCVSLVTTTSSFPNFFIKVCKAKKSFIKLEIITINNNSSAFYLMCKASIINAEGSVVCWSNTRCNYLTEEDRQKPLKLFFYLHQLPSKDQAIYLNTCSVSLEIRISDKRQLSWMADSSIAEFKNSKSFDIEAATQTLQNKMENIYDCKKFCDVTLQLPDTNFEAHKAMLCADSPVFRAMLETDMRESQTGIINIEDIEGNTMDLMLKFMYTNNFEDTQFEETIKLYEAADKYQLKILQEKCVAYLKSNITLENVLQLYHLSDMHSNKILCSYAFAFLVEHISEVLVSEEWKLFSNDNLLLSKKILEKVCIQLAKCKFSPFVGDSGLPPQTLKWWRK